MPLLFFSKDMPVSESSKMCRKEAKKILNARMKALSTNQKGGSSAVKYSKALVEYDKNINGCDNEALRILLENRFTNSTASRI